MKAKLPRRRPRPSPYNIPFALAHKPVDLLEQYTSHDSVWWMARVQQHIKKASGRKRKDGHSRTNVTKWMGALHQDVLLSFPTSGSYDGNMRAAMVTSLVLFTWYARVSRAKVFDPARPLSIRSEAYNGWLRVMGEFQRVMLDDRNDAEYFPGQKWNNPHLPGAKGGTFV